MAYETKNKAVEKHFFYTLNRKIELESGMMLIIAGNTLNIKEVKPESVNLQVIDQNEDEKKFNITRLTILGSALHNEIHLSDLLPNQLEIFKDQVWYIKNNNAQIDLKVCLHKENDRNANSKIVLLEDFSKFFVCEHLFEMTHQH